MLFCPCFVGEKKRLGNKETTIVQVYIGLWDINDASGEMQTFSKNQILLILYISI